MIARILDMSTTIIWANTFVDQPADGSNNGDFFRPDRRFVHDGFYHDKKWAANNQHSAQQSFKVN